MVGTLYLTEALNATSSRIRSVPGLKNNNKEPIGCGNMP